ncbi:MAG: hypothetical protein M1546_04605 [Chloroflexi bacterium]|nr:hypothetical protein [Chloroflexota bacterium]
MAHGHHGELLQGMFSNGDQRSRGLITLPCPLFWSRATFILSDVDGVVVDPVDRVKARRAAELTLAHWGVDGGGYLCLRSNITPKIGLGSSTADVTATIRAVTTCLGKRLSAEAIGRLAVATEIAADSIMFGPRAVLFAQREGLVIEDFGCNLPALEVVGFNAAPYGPGVDTLDFTPAVYSEEEIAQFDMLRMLARTAIRTGDVRLLGSVASASARISQAHLPTPQFQQLEDLAVSMRALGVHVSHSGTVAGLLFDPCDNDMSQRARLTLSQLEQYGCGQAWRFQI